MVRTARFSDTEILVEARHIAAREGLRGLSINRLARACGAPTGSLYHRFSGLAEIKGRLLATAIEAATAALLTALPDQPEAAGLALLRWARTAPDDARVLVRAQTEQVTLPGAFETRCLAARATIDAALEAAMDNRPDRGDAPMDRHVRFRFACIDGPTAAIATALTAGTLDHPDIDRLIADIARAALGTGPSALPDRPRPCG